MPLERTRISATWPVLEADVAFCRSLETAIQKQITPDILVPPTVRLRASRSSERKWLAFEVHCELLYTMWERSLENLIAVGFYIEETDAARTILLARLPHPEAFPWDSLYGNERSLITVEPKTCSIVTSESAATDLTTTTVEATSSGSMASG